MTPRPLSQIPNGEIVEALDAALGVTKDAADALGVTYGALHTRIGATPALAARRKYLQSVHGRAGRNVRPGAEFIATPDQCPRCGLRYRYGARIVVDDRPMCCWCAVEQRAAAARHTRQVAPHGAQRENGYNVSEMTG